MNTHDLAAGLFTAVYEDDEDAVVRMLRAGASPESVDEDGQTVLYLATMITDGPGVVRLLLAAGAEPDRLSSGTDSPLCGAACGGHTEVVRALLAAGARPDLVEEFGFTAMAWAVQRGHAPVVAELLARGADPNRLGPNGEPSLVTAARRGSLGCVRALLEHGARARAEALTEARRWLSLDVAAELRAGLERTHGTGHECVTRRYREDGGVTVEVRLLKAGESHTSGNDQQTGHAAIVTVLETSLGIAAPAPELADRALRCADPDNDDWTEAVTVLARRGDEETFRSAVLWCGDGAQPLLQVFGADVLGRLGAEGGPGQGEEAVRPYAAQSVPLLRELARGAQDPLTLRCVVAALGQHQDPAALPEILRHARHADTGVRRAVAVALCGLVPASHAEGVARLVALSRDVDRDVRNWATTALAVLDADTPALRDALAALLGDPDAEVAAEAARGLAVRQDSRAIPVLERLLAEERPDSTPRATAEEAVEHIRDDRVRTLLASTLPRRI
ncbi:ankyrin repeat domain-containing protein [Streptomyces sp. NBC_00286]|uniref:ankyrin repeat domain-containing protein n=1 Tax=Streptomyces sp. NBC_00286 TaxID=2975701 RepID=UPI002E2DA7C3|nr:ankyrin repeat domain-containing protein [Streptomyces sp. NBC_00286]